MRPHVFILNHSKASTNRKARRHVRFSKAPRSWNTKTSSSWDVGYSEPALALLEYCEGFPWPHLVDCHDVFSIASLVSYPIGSWTKTWKNERSLQDGEAEKASEAEWNMTAAKASHLQDCCLAKPLGKALRSSIQSLHLFGIVLGLWLLWLWMLNDMMTLISDISKGLDAIWQDRI